jgi:hypothetical protein
MALKKCTACARAIPESSAVCGYCGITVAPAPPMMHADEPGADDGLPPLDLVFEPAAPAAPVPLEASEPQAPTQPAAAAGSRRQALTLALGVLGSGVVVLALLSARGAAAPETAAPAPTAARTATAAASQPGSAEPAVPALLDAPRWSVVNDGRWVGRDRRALALEVASANKVQVWMRQVRPVLVVRCLAKSTDVFVFTQSAARMEAQDEDHTVSLRVDDQPAQSARWPDSQEHDALFSPDGASLAQQLMRASTFRFGFTPHNAEPVVAQFDVSGLSKLLTPAANRCGWTSAVR